MKISLKDVLDIPYDTVVEKIAGFVYEKLMEAGVDKAVIGLSGGIDSSTLLYILVRSIGRENVVALIMPDDRVTSRKDTEDALRLARIAGVKHYLVNIGEIIDAYAKLPFYDPNDLMSNGNLRARVRMTILYYYANKHKALVAGSGDRSEILIGYYTKYGDGAADILPLGSLYKTQVRKLGEYLGLPSDIVLKPSSPGFWPGHLAEKEIGIDYNTIDLVLYALFDKNIKPEEIPYYTGVAREVVDKIIRMHRNTRHKRIYPPIPQLPWLDQPVKEI